MPDPWYADGLAFRCTRCGNCCTGPPGVVWVDDDELAAIAEHRGENIGDVEIQYTRMVGKRRSLRERPNGDCVFLDKTAGCTIYPVRPRQCRTWPFWESNLATPQTWEKTRRVCPGAGQGELISAAEITRRIGVIRI
jgi:uncharacterized protein